MLDAILLDVVQPWLDASQHVTVVPPPPADYRLTAVDRSRSRVVLHHADQLRQVPW